MAWGGRRAQLFTRHVLQVHGNVCHLCGLPGATTADHVIPLSKGGAPYDPANGRPAHGSCNYRRNNMDLEDYFAKYPLRTTPALTPSRDW
jgi:5-methylcytosine-specific restriction endonuclease McrA